MKTSYGSSSIVNDNILTEIQKVLMKINVQLENIEKLIRTDQYRKIELRKKENPKKQLLNE